MIKSTFAYKWSRQQTKQLLKFDFIRFGIVGGISFVVSEIFLVILHGHLGVARWLALIISNEAGLITNFTFHETWTYKNVNHHHKSIRQKFFRFHLSSWSGVAIIIGVGLISSKVLGLNVYLGQAIGSAVAMFWNFFWTKYFIFKGHTPKSLLDPEEVVID